MEQDRTTEKNIAFTSGKTMALQMHLQFLNFNSIKYDFSDLGK